MNTKNFSKMIGFLLFTCLFFGIQANTNAQCTPPCNLNFTNKIDCEVDIKIDSIDGNGNPANVIATLQPGTAFSPYQIVLSSIISNCSSNVQQIVSVTIIRVGNCDNSHIVIPINGTTVSWTSSANCCCHRDYAQWQGCNIVLWMDNPCNG